jgi:ABC-type multidrug transport system fused ATPase/permease subunit
LTKLIVSQRASSLKDCDLILVYDNGKIVAQGTAMKSF